MPLCGTKFAALMVGQTFFFVRGAAEKIKRKTDPNSEKWAKIIDLRRKTRLIFTKWTILRK